METLPVVLTLDDLVDPFHNCLSKEALFVDNIWFLKLIQKQRQQSKLVVSFVNSKFNVLEEFRIDPRYAQTRDLLTQHSWILDPRDRFFLLRALSVNPFILNLLSDDLKNDREIVRTSVQHFIYTFKDASIRLRKDRTCVKELLKHHWKIYIYMDSSLKSDRELIMEAIRQSGEAFLFTPTYIQSQDKEIAAMALIQCPSLGISCHPLLYDCDYISQLVRRDGRILQSLPLILKQNPEIVKLAIKSNGMNVKHASLEMLMQNLELIELAVSKNGLALQHVTQHPTFMQYLKSHKISNQKQTTSYLEVIIEKALEQNPMALQYCPDSYRSNLDVVLNLLSRNGMVLEFVSSELQHDLEVVNTALRQNANSLQFVPYEIICKNERSVLSAIMQQNNIQALKYYPKERLWSMYEKILNETS